MRRADHLFSILYGACGAERLNNIIGAFDDCRMSESLSLVRPFGIFLLLFSFIIHTSSCTKPSPEQLDNE